MGRIEYMGKDKFFAKEYKDGFVVAFKNVGDNSDSYADSIHEYVVNNQEQVLFATDIVNALNCPIDISESLYVYSKGSSIRGFGIITYSEKECIEVEYNSEKVLTITKSKWFFERKNLLVCSIVSIVILLAFVAYKNLHYRKLHTREPDVLELNDSTGKKNGIEQCPDESESKIDDKELLLSGDVTFDSVEMEDSVSVVDVDSGKLQSVLIDIDSTEVVSSEDESIKKTEDSVKVAPIVGSVSSTPKQEDTRKDRIKAEASKYVQIAEQAYRDYVVSLNESKGIDALKYYKKALDLNEIQGLFSVSERERIKRRINALEQELK